jgi:hypothetical protein
MDNELERGLCVILSDIEESYIKDVFKNSLKEIEIDNILFKSRSYIIDILPTPKGGGFWL